LFARYAAIVKNLRGVVLFDLEEKSVWESVKWLISRFKYRNLGITPTVYEKYRSKLSRYMSGNPFRLLTFPLRELEEFTLDFTKCLNIKPELGELLVFASLYISPAMIIGDTYSELVSKISVNLVKTCKELTTSDWKLHMRIADYTVLDMYEFSIMSAVRIIENCSTNELQDIINSRLEAIRKDIKRYWRILCNEPDGRVFLYYVDNLKLYVDSCGLEKICGKSNIAPALAVIPVVSIPRGVE